MRVASFSSSACSTRPSTSSHCALFNSMISSAVRILRQPADNLCPDLILMAGSAQLDTNETRFSSLSKSSRTQNHVSGPTGRQSAAVPACVGLPAASKTDSW